jgi:hypothetical protein
LTEDGEDKIQKPFQGALGDVIGVSRAWIWKPRNWTTLINEVSEGLIVVENFSIDGIVGRRW